MDEANGVSSATTGRRCEWRVGAPVASQRVVNRGGDAEPPSCTLVDAVLYEGLTDRAARESTTIAGRTENLKDTFRHLARQERQRRSRSAVPLSVLGRRTHHHAHREPLRRRPVRS